MPGNESAMTAPAAEFSCYFYHGSGDFRRRNIGSACVCSRLTASAGPSFMALGFGFNKTKVMAAAEKFVQQGKLQNAIT